MSWNVYIRSCSRRAPTKKSNHRWICFKDSPRTLELLFRFAGQDQQRLVLMALVWGIQQVESEKECGRDFSNSGKIDLGFWNADKIIEIRPESSLVRKLLDVETLCLKPRLTEIQDAAAKHEGWNRKEWRKSNRSDCRTWSGFNLLPSTRLFLTLDAMLNPLEIIISDRDCQHQVPLQNCGNSSVSICVLSESQIIS
jgi:hypothetical protein